MPTANMEFMENPSGMVQERINIYYLLDTSASMSGSKIEQLNSCMIDLKPVLEAAGIENGVEIVVRAIQFGNNGKAAWHTGDAANGVPIDKFTWVNLRADGPCTPTSQALNEVAKALHPEFLGKRAHRPVVILATDGDCTDPGAEYAEACENIKNAIKGVATRIAVGVGSYNRPQLEMFASRGAIGESADQPYIFTTQNAEELKDIIRWASVVTIKVNSNTGIDDTSGNVLPAPGDEDNDWL